MEGFKYKIGDLVVIEVSKEKGLIVGRAEYSNSENGYLLRYNSGMRGACEEWWGESALKAATIEPE